MMNRTSDLGSRPSPYRPDRLGPIAADDEFSNDQPIFADTTPRVDPTSGDVDCTADAAGESDWPPLSLEVVPSVEAFPVDFFPGPVAHFVNAVSDAIGCPPDFVALPVLVVAGAAVGRSVMLQLKPGYLASAALYGMNVGVPSSGKSPALDAVVRPLWQIDAELQADYRLRKQEHGVKMEAYNAASEGAKPLLPVKPTPESAVIGDTTTEALVRQLSLNPRGLLVAFDEGSAWVNSIGHRSYALLNTCPCKVAEFERAWEVWANWGIF